jgi:hypothetical protein
MIRTHFSFNNFGLLNKLTKIMESMIKIISSPDTTAAIIEIVFIEYTNLLAAASHETLTGRNHFNQKGISPITIALPLTVHSPT